jgi:hypothetical protein
MIHNFKVWAGINEEKTLPMRSSTASLLTIITARAFLLMVSTRKLSPTRPFRERMAAHN